MKYLVAFLILYLACLFGAIFCGILKDKRYTKNNKLKNKAVFIECLMAGMILALLFELSLLSVTAGLIFFAWVFLSTSQQGRAIMISIIGAMILLKQYGEVGCIMKRGKLKLKKSIF